MNNNQKGSLTIQARKTFRDAVTGKLVTRLTSDGVLSHHPYFYNRIFTSQGSGLLFATRHEGVSSLHLMNLESGESRQLTDGQDIMAFSANLSPGERWLYYVRGQSIVRTCMEDLHEETVYTTQEGWLAYDNPGMGADGEYMVTVEMKEEDRIETHGGWSAFEAQWEARPHCRIVRIHLATGRSEVMYEERCWLGHPQLRPGDCDTIMYCHEGPAHKVDSRVWLLREGKGISARPQSPGEMISHEYWHPDGTAIAYVYRTQRNEGWSSSAVVDPLTYRPITNEAELKQQIRLLDPDTLQERVVMDCSPYCHFISNDDHSLIVGDGQTEHEGYLYLADPATGRETVLCGHGSSWRSYGTTQDAHPHPVFTPDGKHVVFTSDRDGLPAVYMVEL
ncbi:oligogalacturonate lyase family protein [Paenibacillus sp. strain BS8-2]